MAFDPIIFINIEDQIDVKDKVYGTDQIIEGGWILKRGDTSYSRNNSQTYYLNVHSKRVIKKL